MVIVEEFDTEFGHITIIRSRDDGAYTYLQDECFHSQATPDGTSTCAYVHVMYSILRQSHVRNVLMIGCAGGTLATMLHRLGIEVTVVDINPLSFVLAKKYFKLSDEVRCVTDDGWSYLVSTSCHYDAIAIDAFDNDGLIPRTFTTENFFRVTKKVLSARGVAVMNVMTSDDFDMSADRIALNMEAAEMPARLFDWPGRYGRNTIVTGGGIGKLRVFAHKKPQFVRDDIRGITCRGPKRRMLPRWGVS
ncbi:MAG: spermidine synthase [Pseudomonadota bacterium]